MLLEWHGRQLFQLLGDGVDGESSRFQCRLPEDGFDLLRSKDDAAGSYFAEDFHLGEAERVILTRAVCEFVRSSADGLDTDPMKGAGGHETIGGPCVHEEVPLE